ncbi:TAT-variant-translocated molybdopterin oxidoreductase [Acidobacteria bacterium AH-259-D05]|nr:TAT-variant-translocated molybdopterin oxidoreductase [Acidobacteria bacterium AH-259-D05]
MKEALHATGKNYWRSLERLLDSPALREALADEFPEGAADPPDGMSRRTVLKLMGASFALAGLASCRRPEEKIVPYVSAPENVIPGIPKYYATTMCLGTSAYGIVVESHEGRPTKIEGNSLHPSSQGAAGSWMQAAILGLYDPDRSPKVLHRPQVETDPQESSWEEFLEFWTQLSSEAESSDGKGLAILTESYSSPTVARLAGQFQDRFPRAQWVVYEPVGDENIYEGLRVATGEAYRPLYHLEKAETVLALDSDFLLTESESLAQARAFAAGRRVKRGEMSRLYVVESTLSLTGAMADHRLPLQSRQITGFAAALALQLKDLGVPLDLTAELRTAPLSGGIVEKLEVIARNLAASRGEALVLAGRRQPPEVHALVFAINRALGALEQSLSLRELKDTGWTNSSDFKALLNEMHRGAISTLIVLGGNPMYTLPADLEFQGALRRVTHTIHLSTHVDETSQLVKWHLPQAHFLESWGDARAADGSVSVIQPLIAPLFEGRSSSEVLALLVRDQEVKGNELVRDTWLESILGGEDFESRWLSVLHDGILKDSALPPVTVTLQEEALQEVFKTAAKPRPITEAGKTEIVFQVSPALYDGRFSNNGWLQELPDPITKITWDNAALVSPKTAQDTGVENGDVVSLDYRGNSIEAPVWILPGQADDSVILALGYGRNAAGRVGENVGANAYLLRRSHAPYFDGGLRITRTGRSHQLAQTQEHGTMEGRSMVWEATLNEYRLEPDFASQADEPVEPESLWKEHDYSEGYQWGMAIDLNACIGCNACTVACQSENNIPIVGQEQVRRGREMHWLRVDRYFSGDAENPEVAFQPVPCMHCENAPCEQVCPVAATVHDGEGINAMVYNRCIGTRYCSNNCPYKVRRFNFFNYTKDLPELVQMAMNPDVTVRSRGVMEKCTYCIQRINQAKYSVKQLGRRLQDGEVKTACQQTCPTDAIVFGNINDPRSRVAQLKRQNRNYVLLAELNNKPRTSYLAKLRNSNPDWDTHAEVQAVDAT